MRRLYKSHDDIKTRVVMLRRRGVKITQQTLASWVGVPCGTMQNWLNGWNDMPKENIKVLNKGLKKEERMQANREKYCIPIESVSIDDVNTKTMVRVSNYHNEQKNSIGLRVSDELRDSLFRIAKEHNKPVSMMIKIVLEDYVSKL